MLTGKEIWQATDQFSIHICKTIDIDIKYILLFTHVKYSMFTLFSKRC